ncbi:hypothetical protein [Streptomyces sp. NPDC056169]|uniref:hypothetical protein n=1 Tax=Streptomyces sp. NPDC056169 TaxID=3345734 RepID=UPI0035E23F09
MSQLTAQDRGDLAAEMLPVAARLAVIVQGDGGVQDVEELLDELDQQRQTALLVVLAGLVDPDSSLGTVLGWLDFDEHGAPAEAVQTSRRTLRDLVVEPAPMDAGVDEVAVERALSHPAGAAGVRLNRDERRLGVDRGIRRGLSYEQVAERLGMSVPAVKRAWDRAKDRARAEGRYVPAQPVGQISSVA